jgi:hypothetical protein
VSAGERQTPNYLGLALPVAALVLLVWWLMN